MVVLFVVAAFAPAGVALGLVFWRRFIVHEEAATGLLRGVAVGLGAGALLGTAVALILLLLVVALSRALGRA
jgi:hypothetical protein